jgi:hypothetical protein
LGGVRGLRLWFGGRLAGGFRFDEPWDSPNNRKLHNLTPYTVLHCPCDPASPGSTETNFVAVVGPGTVFPSDGTSRRLADVSDGPENTLMVVEIVGAGIHWMEPKELLGDDEFPAQRSNTTEHFQQSPFWEIGLYRSPRPHGERHGHRSRSETPTGDAQSASHDRRRGEN